MHISGELLMAPIKIARKLNSRVLNCLKSNLLHKNLSAEIEILVHGSWLIIYAIIDRFSEEISLLLTCTRLKFDILDAITARISFQSILTVDQA